MSDKENKTTATPDEQPSKAPQEQATPGKSATEQATPVRQGEGFVMVGESVSSEPATDKNESSAADQNLSANEATEAPADDSASKSDNASVDKTKTAPATEAVTENKPLAEAAESKPATENKPSATATSDSRKNAAPPNATATPTPGVKPAAKNNSIVALSALVIALGAAAASGYTFWQQQEKTSVALAQLSERNSQLEAQLQRQAQALNSLQSLPAATSQLNQTAQTLHQQQEQQKQNLQDLATAFASTQGPKPSDWLQAEAEYLLRLANHRLQLEGDLAGAKTLLESADERLTKADNPALFVVREAIANELAELGGTDALDKSGLYFKLTAVEGQIDLLPLPMDPENRSQFRQTQLEEHQDQSVWQTLWSEAKTLVVVRHRDEKIAPLLPPEESLYLRHNLRLTLQQAQIALLKEEQELFRTLLVQASSWVQTHFDQNAARTQNVLSTLNALADKNIRQQRPDISASLNLLRNLQKQRFSSSVPAATPAVDKAEAPST